MSVIPRPMTYEDLQQTPSDGQRYEIVDGEPVVSPSPAQLHQRLVVRLLRLIDAYLRQHHLAETLFPAPMDLRLSEHNIVQPDLIYVSTARRRILANPALIDGIPDLVVEILSPSNRPYDEQIKYRLYERAGVPEYWLVDPEYESVLIFTLGDGVYAATAAANASHVHSVVLPGLTINVSALFADLR